MRDHPASVTYPGDCTADFPADKLMGYHGRHYLPASATYDAATNRTTVELRRLNDLELIEFLDSTRVETIESVQDRLRVAGLFGGAL